MLYTSYFSNCKNEPLDKQYAITCGKPKFFHGNWLGIVGPDRQLLTDYKNGIVDDEAYERIYTTYLNANKENILREIKKLPDDCILLCYEGPGKFCHRHILAEWLRNNGIAIMEKDNYKKNMEEFQMNL